jgi:hypothetical protein
MTTLGLVLHTKQRAPAPVDDHAPPGLVDAPEPPRHPPFPVEDRTDPDARRRIAELQTMRLWILSERARGNEPN